MDVPYETTLEGAFRTPLPKVKKVYTGGGGGFGGGPVGLDAVAAAISEEKGTIEDVIEPYLIQQGYLVRTPRGRVATPKCFLHLGLDVPERSDILAHENRQQQIPNLPE